MFLPDNKVKIKTRYVFFIKFPKYGLKYGIFSTVKYIVFFSISQKVPAGRFGQVKKGSLRDEKAFKFRIKVAGRKESSKS
jgi:hypothetical protein